MGFTDARKASHTQGDAFTIGRHLPPKESCISHGARCLPVGALQCGTGRRAPKSQGIPRQSTAAERHGVPIISAAPAERHSAGLLFRRGVSPCQSKAHRIPSRADSSEKSAAVSISPANVRCIPSALLLGSPPERQPVAIRHAFGRRIWGGLHLLSRQRLSLARARAERAQNSGTPAIIGFSRSAPPRKSINGFCTRKNLSNGAVWWSNRGDFLPAPSPLQGSYHPLPLSGGKKLH